MAGPMGGGPRRGPRGPVQKPKNAKGTIIRLFRYIFKHKGLFIGMLVFAAISSLATVSGSLFIKPIVDDYLTPMVGQTFTKELVAPLIRMMAVWIPTTPSHWILFCFLYNVLHLAYNKSFHSF